MKLIELLARDLKEWPDDTFAITQDEGGALNGSTFECPPVLKGTAWVDGAFYLDSPTDPQECFVLEPADDYDTAIVTREMWETAMYSPIPTTPTLETMLTEWRDLTARAQAAQAEADALFEHAGQCHGEIVVRLAELGWGAPRMVPGEPVVTLDDNDGWVVEGHTAPDDATHYGAETSQFNEGFYKLTGDDWMFRTITGNRWLTLGKKAGGDDTSRFISRPSTQP